MSTYSVAAFAASLIFVVAVVKFSKPSKLDAIPTVGSSSWLGSWLAGFRYATNAIDSIQEGYEKHQRAPFKIAAFHRWMVILSSREHIEELSRAPDDAFSLLEAVRDKVEIEYTMGRELYHNPYHTHILRSRLTRNVEALYPAVRDEIIAAFDDILDLRDNEWKSVLTFSGVQEVVSRLNNRIFLGLPLCRNPDWIDLSTHFSEHVIKGALTAKQFPAFLKPLAIRLFTKIGESHRRGWKLLGPIIKERQKFLDEYGNEWADKPNDLLSWLMEEAEGPELTVEALTARIFDCNFAANHTTSAAFTNAIFYLASNPQYIQPLREEVEGIIEQEGWSKTALSKMRKVDSFLRESARLESPSGLSLIRKAMKDYTFADGTFIPKGTGIAVASRSIHHDEALHSNADAFQPFHGDDGEGGKYQYVSTASEYLSFGHGKHACPGRFYASTTLKTMLAHVVVTYDVKWQDKMTKPLRRHLAVALMFDPDAKVAFRKRIV